MRPLPLVGHLLEMIGAMALGMVVLPPLTGVAVRALVDGSTLQAADSLVGNSPELQSLLMATAMVVPSAVWMRLRGHLLSTTLEMALAMYAGFVVLFPLHRLSWISAGDMMMLGHLLMVGFMLLAILARRRQYLTSHITGAAAGPAQTV